MQISKYIHALYERGISLEMMSKYYGMSIEDLQEIIESPVDMGRGRKISLNNIATNDLNVILEMGLKNEKISKIVEATGCSRFIITQLLMKNNSENFAISKDKRYDGETVLIRTQKSREKEIKRGQICYYKFPETGEHIQKGVRPCLVVGNDMQNKYSQITLVVPITSSKKKKNFPVHVEIPSGFPVCGTVLCEQIITVSKENLEPKNFVAPSSFMNQVDRALEIELGLQKDNQKIEQLEEELAYYKKILVKLKKLQDIDLKRSEIIREHRQTSLELYSDLNKLDFSEMNDSKKTK